MADSRRLLWIILAVGICSSENDVAAAVATDCERPPMVDNGSFQLVDDETGDFVSAMYQCATGYRLHGEAELFCDLGTDEWQGDPPVCRPETTTTTTSAPAMNGPNRRRKQNLQNIEEDTSIDSAYARLLDLSCVGRERGESIRPPAIDYAYVAKYNRRKKDGNVFLVAFYECEDDYDMESTKHDRLYCSKDSWIGERPRCIHIGGANGEDDDEEGDEDYGDGDENDDDGGDDENGNDDENETGQETNDYGDNDVTQVTEPTVQDSSTPEPINIASNVHESSTKTIVGTESVEDDENNQDNEIYNENAVDETLIEQNRDISQNGDDNNEHTNDLNYKINEVNQAENNTIERSTECSDPIRNECDHGCRVIYDNNHQNGRTECFCSNGFALDPIDERTCHDIDECSVDNGGCEQICTNLVGSVECSCNAGLQIESTNGKTCVDVNECLLRNGHGLCQDRCTNLFGSYRCSCDGLPGTFLARDGHRCVDAGDCRVNNGGCSQKCVSSHGRVFCKCDEGYVLRRDFKTCKDINECHDPAIRRECPHGCVNTPGSYHCQNQPSSANEVYDTEEATEKEHTPSELMTTEKSCSDGLRLDSNGECVDIDECAERQNGCEHCRNVFAGFECTCPAGYMLNDDEKTCRDVDECSRADDDEIIGCSHDCQNTPGSYRCLCPDGFQLQADGRSCVRQSDACETNAAHCSPGRCVAVDNSYRCECPAGYQEKAKRCHDVNECSLNAHNCTHSCVNTEGSFRCDCPPGWKLDEDGWTCIDIDECIDGDDEDLCDEDTDCVNSIGSYKCVRQEEEESNCDQSNGGCSHICGVNGVCSCPHGMRLTEDGYNCEIIHPCDVDNGGCSHECNRVDLSCMCPTGWSVVGGGKQCRDVDECELNNGGCDQDCINEEGTFRCDCADGFVRDVDHPSRCVDINECETENGGCSHQCINEAGSHHCGCPAGYNLDEDTDKRCVDINECLLNNGRCSHLCHNVPGSMHCACPKGQSLQSDGRTCETDNECDLNNGGCSHSCRFVGGKVECSCPAGYALHDSTNCVDIDECAEKNGNCEDRCENRNGTHVCLCGDGFELRRDGRTCVDTDECIEENGLCSNICINLIGSHACACETGYQLAADRKTCVDIDECVEITHGCSHECRNLNGSFECGCPQGYAAPDHFFCEDIDECVGELGQKCVHGCENTVGSYNCTCPTGHRLREDGISCADIDECEAEGAQRCSHGCLNRVGSWECTCPNGWQLGEDHRTCHDIDECAANRALCSHTCTNLPGSYRCSCPTGYRMEEDAKQCSDINECHFDNGGCSHECINERGSHRCSCPIGQSLIEDGRQCQTDNLCAYENGGCQHECSILDGGVQCSCRVGFVINRADNSSCVDVDECLLEPGVCQHECINVVGSFKCKCHRGYRLNEQNQCLDVDECQVANGGCPATAKCIDLVGSHRCMCQPGFRMSADKTSCVEIKDLCRPAAKPENGHVKCTRSRHRTLLFYKTKCTFTCNKGYRMLGPAILHCNGTGHWNSAESTMCISETCPRFEKPSHGIITPAACLSGGIYPGERCILHCDAGFKATERRIAVCNPQLQWDQSTNLTCMAVPALAIKPFIRCPPDATMVLKPNQTTLLLRMERPRTNVDWHRYVDAHPAWGKKLQTYLSPGVHTVTFRARSANSNAVDICRTVITVKEMRPPAVTDCPANMVVQLRAGEVSREVQWQEPLFHSSSQLREVFKSKLPGEPLTAGVHQIKYVAIDQDELSASCEFNITVNTYFHPKRVVLHQGQRSNSGIVHLPDIQSGQHARKLPQQTIPPKHDLGPTEAYVMCPNRVAMKLDTTFPYKLPRGCVIKYVKLPSYNHIRRRHSNNNNNMLQHYSSWDNPKKSGSIARQHYRRQFE